MRQEYDIVIDTPKHHYRGTAIINAKGNEATALIDIADVVSAESHGTRDDKDYEFSGQADVNGVGIVEYTAKGQLWGNSLDFKADSNIGEIVLFGTVADTASRESKTIDAWQGGNSVIDYLL